MPAQTAMVVKIIENAFGEKLSAENIERVPTGKFNRSYTVRLADRELVVRIAPPDKTVFCFYERNMMRQEPVVHKLLREKTSLPVPEIILADFGRKVLDRDYLVLEKLPGVPLSEAYSLDVRQMETTFRELGRYLRELHSITGDRYGYLGEHRPMPPQGSWSAAFAIMWNRLIDDVVSVGGYSAGEAAAMRAKLEQNIDAVDRKVKSSLLHMDIWHQNILVDDDGRITGIVDWDRALWGDPEIEYAVLDYCGIPNGAFWDGYGKSRHSDKFAGKRQILYLLYELQKYIVIRKARDHRPAEAVNFKMQCLKLAQNL